MPDDIDVYRAASALLQEHGADAWFVAAQRVDEWFSKGNVDGFDIRARYIGYLKPAKFGLDAFCNDPFNFSRGGWLVVQSYVLIQILIREVVDLRRSRRSRFHRPTCGGVKPPPFWRRYSERVCGLDLPA